MSPKTPHSTPPRVNRGVCEFETKYRNALSANASALIVINNNKTEVTEMKVMANSTGGTIQRG